MNIDIVVVVISVVTAIRSIAITVVTIIFQPHIARITEILAFNSQLSLVIFDDDNNAFKGTHLSELSYKYQMMFPFVKGEKVSIFVDLMGDGKKGFVDQFYKEKTVYIGDGISQLDRLDYFSGNGGVAIEMTERIYECTPFPDLLKKKFVNPTTLKRIAARAALIGFPADNFESLDQLTKCIEKTTGSIVFFNGVYIVSGILMSKYTSTRHESTSPYFTIVKDIF
ncbi:hypothetical protein PPL_06110 [Heterostelium album PN500]|uniref:Uncharacterized protein n=1 Tax=Heterostelium pallidum (strain ATCC 26659 / Pp 5 / PN500) TaxID=670386 RepID=D3BC87_HETP5|nr:hypothetical protein PPL_06110 [Heterostelium album PN500]EFA81270.1 hypothetical protein PPL_06110 [Heterostelium album PN500]|eukprot:XP_020433388.1 hypothetical protein PPL_06110 [Heterostelium album PN500]